MINSPRLLSKDWIDGIANLTTQCKSTGRRVRDFRVCFAEQVEPLHEDGFCMVRIKLTALGIVTRHRMREMISGICSHHPAT